MLHFPRKFFFLPKNTDALCGFHLLQSGGEGQVPKRSSDEPGAVGQRSWAGSVVLETRGAL